MNIALIDDHTMVSESLRNSLTSTISNADIRIFDKAKSFLTHDFSEWSPDVVISDIMMPELDGIQLFSKARPLLKASCKFIFLSAVSDLETIKNTMSAGANGFVSKSSAMEELLQAIDTVQSGKQFISQSLKDDLLNYVLSDQRPADSILSPREKEVLQKLCAGLTTKEIAFEMNLSLSTVQLYNTSILKKFKFTRTIDLVTFAIAKGIYKNFQA